MEASKGPPADLGNDPLNYSQLDLGPGFTLSLNKQRKDPDLTAGLNAVRVEILNNFADIFLEAEHVVQGDAFGSLGIAALFAVALALRKVLANELSYSARLRVTPSGAT